MNEEYLKTLYEHIGGSEKGINYDSFKKDMSTNKEYNTTIYNHIGGKKSGIDYNSFINDTGLKKKDKSKLSSQEKLWGSSSKPKDVYTTLVTEAPKTATVSDSLNGKGKVKTQTPSKDKLTPINEDDENDDDFWSYLDNTLTSGIMSATKALIDTPEMLYDFAVQHAPEHGLDPTGAELPSSTFGVKSPKTAGVIMRDISEKNKIAPSKMLMKDLGISNVPSKQLKSGLDILNKKIEKKRQEYGGDPISAIEKGEYSNAAKLIAGTTVQSAPMMAIAIGTGGSAAGLTAIGTLTASQTYQQDIDNKKLSQGEKLGHAAISGVIESTLGHLFTGASGAVAKRILQEQGEQVGSKLIGNSLRSVIEKNIAKTPLTGLLGEVAEESGVEFGNQANDIAFGIRDDFDYKSIANAGLSSTGFGGVNTVSVYGAKAYMSAKKYNQVKNTNKAISRLQNEINNEGISEESKKIFQIKSDELVASNKKLLGEEIEKLKTLSSEDKELLNKTNTIIDDVMSSIDTIKDDKTLSPEAKKIAVNEIYKDYVEAQKTKKQILSKLDNVQVDGDFSNFTGVPLDFNVETSGVSALPIGEQDRLNRQALESLNSELNPTGTEQVDITRDMVSKKAYELYNEEQKAKENIVEEVPTEEKDVLNEPTLVEEKPVEKVTTIDSTEPVVEDTQVKDVKEPTEVKEVKDQAIDIFKAGLEAIKVAKATSKAKLKSVTDVIDSLTKGEDGKTKSGKITVKQANSLIKRIGILNLDNPKTTEKLIDYASKIIENANYKDKLDDLDTTISSIKTKLKSKDIDTEVSDLVKKIVSIDLKDVDDLDAHSDVLNNINQNIKGSSTVGGRLKISNAIDKSALSEYAVKLEDFANIKKRKEINDYFESYTGLSSEDFSIEEMNEIMYNPEPSNSVVEKVDKLGDKIDKSLSTMVALLRSAINTGKDSFTGEQVNISENIKDNAKKILSVDTSIMNNKDKLLYIDAINNILVNGDSNKIESIVNINEANKKAKEFSESNKASKLKLFFSTSLGKFWNKQFSSLYNITENLFKGFGAGNKFMEAIGFPEIQKGAIKAQVKTDLFFSNIGNKYFKTNPNGLKFNDSYNKYERGIAAALIRSTKGNEDVDFQKEKTLLENSIDALSKGNKEERERAVDYKKVYDKLFVDNNSLNPEDILKNIDETNKQVVLDVIEEYKKQKQDKDDVARKYYNISLGDEQNYTPISYAKLSYDSSKAEDVDSFSTSLLDNSQSVYDKKSGSFIPAVKPSGIKKGSYRDYDFEYVNINGMKASLTDVNTAKHIQYLKTFIESDSFSKIIEDPEDRRLFISRIKDFVDIKRGRENYFANKSEIKPILNVFRKISNLGATKVLGSATQILKQPIPPAVNTIINAGRLDLIDAFDSDWNDFINDSGFEISIRGLESSSDYVKMNDLIDAASKTKGEQLMKLLSNQQDFFLKNFLAKPDVFIARASWISFYKQYLKDRGIDISDIKDHEINEDAAMYAQRQVDRQQNVSDTALEGKWFTSKDPGVQISRMFLLPFAKFALNQKSRLYSDLRTLSSTDNIWSKDKTVAAKSFVGMAVEMAAFRMISGYISQLIVEVMNNLTGYEESDEEKEKRRKTMIESQTKNTIVDYFSPFPATDPIVLFGFNKVLDQIQDEYGVKGKDKLDIGTHIDKDLFDKFGMIGIGLKGISEIAEYEKLTITGEYKKNGVTRKISEEDKKNLEDFRTLFYLYQLGLLPSEFGSVSRRLQKIAESREKKRKTMKLY